ncbi:MAG: hypothetical protein R3C68_00470 [Myxococcota bacterium]
MAVRLSGRQMLVIDGEAGLWCWGYNDFGQLLIRAESMMSLRRLSDWRGAQLILSMLA